MHRPSLFYLSIGKVCLGHDPPLSSDELGTWILKFHECERTTVKICLVVMIFSLEKKAALSMSCLLILVTPLLSFVIALKAGLKCRHQMCKSYFAEELITFFL